MIYIPIYKATEEINFNYGWAMQSVGSGGSILLSLTCDDDLMVPEKATGVQYICNSGVC